MLKASKHEADSKMSIPVARRRVVVDDDVDRLQVEVQ